MAPDGRIFRSAFAALSNAADKMNHYNDPYRAPLSWGEGMGVRADRITGIAVASAAAWRLTAAVAAPRFQPQWKTAEEPAFQVWPLFQSQRIVFLLLV